MKLTVWDTKYNAYIVQLIQVGMGGRESDVLREAHVGTNILNVYLPTSVKN